MLGNIVNDITNGIINGGAKLVKTIGNIPSQALEKEKEKDMQMLKNTLNKPIAEIVKNNEYIGLIKKPTETGVTPTQENSAVQTPKPEVEVSEETEKNMQKELEKLYEREDAIRKETQEREDTAYQRAVADMRKAGIDPNLLGVTPAMSGGGITSATKKDFTRLNEETNVLLTLLTQALDHEFTKEENTKDRIAETIQSVLGIFQARKKL